MKSMLMVMILIEHIIGDIEQWHCMIRANTYVLKICIGAGFYHFS